MIYDTVLSALTETMTYNDKLKNVENLILPFLRNSSASTI